MVTDTSATCAPWCDDHDEDGDECVHKVGSFVLDDGAPFRGPNVRADEDHPVMVQVRQFVDRPSPLVEVQLGDTSGLEDTDWLTPGEAAKLGRLLLAAASDAESACPFEWCSGCVWEADIADGSLSRFHGRLWPSGVNVCVMEYPGRWDAPQATIPPAPDGNMDEVTDAAWLFAVSVDLIQAAEALRSAIKMVEGGEGCDRSTSRSLRSTRPVTPGPTD